MIERFNVRAADAARRKWNSWHSTCWLISRRWTSVPSPARRCASSSTWSSSFCHDWRSLWYLHGRHAGITEPIRKSRGCCSPEVGPGAARAGRQHGQLRAHGPPVPVAGNAVRRCQRSRQEAAEFNADSTKFEGAAEITTGSGCNLPASLPDPNCRPRLQSRLRLETAAGRAAAHHPECSKSRQHAAVRDAGAGGGRLHDRWREPSADREHRRSPAGSRRRFLQPADEKGCDD